MRSVVAPFVFDTHRAVKDLAAAGFPEAQVEAQVEIVGAAVGENAATKSDLDAMERRTIVRIDALEQRMESRSSDGNIGLPSVSCLFCCPAWGCFLPPGGCCPDNHRPFSHLGPPIPFRPSCNTVQDGRIWRA